MNSLLLKLKNLSLLSLQLLTIC